MKVIEEVKTVPVHSLGISQIIVYGSLFYVFALIKSSIAEKLNLSLEIVALTVSLSLFIHVVTSIHVGVLIDKHGGMRVMSIGLLVGALGLFTLGLSDTLYSFIFSMFLVGIAFSLASYNIAFSTAIQLDDKNSRHHITVITFYGAIASSLVWLIVGKLLPDFGLEITCYFLSLCLLLMGVHFFVSSFFKNTGKISKKIETFVSMKFSQLIPRDKKIIIFLMALGFIQYLIFATTALSLVDYFSIKFEVYYLAVVLASIYGPFQLVGRLIEMGLANKFDARNTGFIAAIVMPCSLILLFSSNYSICILSMALFGMSNGLLTVTNGYLPNLFFEPSIIGRIKGYIGAPTALGMSCAPFISGIFSENLNALLVLMILLSLIPIVSIFLLKREQQRAFI